MWGGEKNGHHPCRQHTIRIKVIQEKTPLELLVINLFKLGDLRRIISWHYKSKLKIKYQKCIWSHLTDF